MVEFHIDVHRSFQETMYLTEFGGNESLQKPKCDKIIILFGHDKALFNKDTFTSKCCSRYNLEQLLMPNSEVMGLMVSAIQLHEFEF